ncbi:unnamed protein product [Dibothriocephalus latus]|uniref:Uncharacterized protein n=1 Tax=Dibothriocephalus latus TaxID=60516 RepID=A0A3P7LB14_DIBLA|nr:unnamed protein product [Dibothriocephalus latus]
MTNVDSIYINSKYPVTIHRIEQYVKNKEAKDRFIVDKDMTLSKCPKYRQTGLTWKFPGSLATRSKFECFQEGNQLCKGVTTGNETGKCVVTMEGNNLIHRRVVNASNNGVEFFYCYLDKATPQRALTYNVDWRNSSAIPRKGVPPELLFPVIQPKTGIVSPPTAKTSAAQHLTAPEISFEE